MAKKKRRIRAKSRLFLNNIIVSSVLSFIFKIAPVVLALGIGLFLIKVAISQLIYSDYFSIKQVRVVGERAESVLAANTEVLNSKRGMNIFSVDLKGCAESISYRNPELRDVRVRRVLPDRLEVSYKLRSAFCQIADGHIYLVSEDGVVYSEPLPAPRPELPIITGIDIPARPFAAGHQPRSRGLTRAIGLLKEIRDSDFSNDYKIIKINAADWRNPSLYLEDGTRIELGEYSFKEKKGPLKEVLNDLRANNKRAKIIDLRFEDIVVLPY